MDKLYRDGILYLQAGAFGSDEILHFFTSRRGWEQDRIFQQLEDFIGKEDQEIYRGSQVHGTRIVKIEDQEAGDLRTCEFDGLVTNRRGKLLISYHADCSPVYFYDSKLGVIGLAHSGWRGSLEDISGRMLDIFTGDYGSCLGDIKVLLGPSICRDCYQVGPDVYRPFREKFGQEVLDYKDDGVYLSIGRAIELALLRKGLDKENILRASQCTACDPDLYSYRKEASKARMLAGIVLRG